MGLVFRTILHDLSTVLVFVSGLQLNEKKAIRGSSSRRRRLFNDNYIENGRYVLNPCRQWLLMSWHGRCVLVRWLDPTSHDRLCTFLKQWCQLRIAGHVQWWVSVSLLNLSSISTWTHFLQPFSWHILLNLLCFRNTPSKSLLPRAKQYNNQN